MARISSLFAALVFGLSAITSAWSAEPLKLLFLGDNGHHQPAERFEQLQPVLKERGIELTYTDKVDDLNAETLGKYAGLVIYANHEKISPEQEQALLDYVAGGKGFIPLHCASYCFLNSPKYIELVGAQFQRHGTGTFRTILAEAEHPIMQGFGGFESWDETYVHTKHNEKDRTVLEYRVDGEGASEPWTWVRTHGKGRVFYTAWGHDQRTWGNPGFQNLVERGIRWAVGRRSGRRAGVSPIDGRFPVPQMTPPRTDVQAVRVRRRGEDRRSIRRAAAGHDGRAAEQDAAAAVARRVDEAPSSRPSASTSSCSPPSRELGGKPICMTWDERGRLWVCETVRLSERAAAARARAATASASAKTPTATAGPTSSPSSPRS